MNVDWITWKTDLGEIINPDTIENQMDVYFDHYSTYMKPIVYEQIKYEILNGGLSRDAFNISGDSPSNEMAIEIIRKIEQINDTYVQMKMYIRKSIEEQKQVEKKQLIQCITEKIKQEEEKMNQDDFNLADINKNIQSLKDKLKSAQLL